MFALYVEYHNEFNPVHISMRLCNQRETRLRYETDLEEKARFFSQKDYLPTAWTAVDKAYHKSKNYVHTYPTKFDLESFNRHCIVDT